MDSVSDKRRKSSSGTNAADYFRDYFREKFGYDVFENEDAAGPAQAPPRPLRRAIDRAIKRRSREDHSRTPARRSSEGKKRRALRRQRERRNRQYFDRAREELTRRWESMGIPTRYVKVIPRPVWVMCWHIIADGDGDAARHYLSRCRNKSAAGALRRAATADGRRPWTSITARRIAAIGLAEYALSESTQRLGRWRRIVRGVLQKALIALITPPGTGTGPHLQTMRGRGAWNGSYRNGTLGYLQALKDAGFHTYQQLPADQVAPWERVATPRGVFAICRYWIVGNNPFDAENPEHRRQIVELAAAELAELEAERRRRLDGDQVDGDPVDQDGDPVDLVDPAPD